MGRGMPDNVRVLNAPPNWPFDLPVAEGDAEEKATGGLYIPYAFDAPPQRIGDVRAHKFLIPYDIGTWTNGNRGGSMVSGLGQNQVVTYDVDQTPEFWFITLDSLTVATALVRAYLGPGVGGPSWRLGAKGRIRLPAQGQNYLTLINLGAGVANGTVVAVRGFHSDFDMDAQG